MDELTSSQESLLVAEADQVSSYCFFLYPHLPIFKTLSDNLFNPLLSSTAVSETIVKDLLDSPLNSQPTELKSSGSSVVEDQVPRLRISPVEVGNINILSFFYCFA